MKKKHQNLKHALSPLAALLALTGALQLSGCSMTGCGAAMETAPGVNEGNDDTAVQLQAAATLAGAYKAKASAKEPLRGLLLVQRSEGRSFVAERQLAGCQHTQRVEGSWRVSGSNLTLDIKGSASERYRYERTTTGLTLYDGTTVVGRLGSEGTFCTRSSDCDLQRFTHMECVGQALCTSEQRCGYACGGEVKRGYGDMCGGIAGFRCETGLECSMEDNRGCTAKVPFPDQAGLCRTAAKASDPCAGFLCVTGETCKLGDSGPSCVADKVDVCARVRCTGERPHCVEISGASPSAQCLPADQCHRDSDCGSGQRCAPAPQNPSNPQEGCANQICVRPLLCQ